MTCLEEVAASLVAPGKGILAADESIGTMSKRLVAAGVPASETARRDYRELLLTTQGLPAHVSGIIWCDETLRQELASGTPFPAAARELGIHAGIKVDAGVTPLPSSGGATVTEGLDGLRDRLKEYREMGAAFAKWRAVLDPESFGPRVAAANAHGLARYAALCQEAGLVPIVEPEVLMTGSHGIERCEAVTTEALEEVFGQLSLMGVDPAGMVLKPNMVIEADGSGTHAEPGEVARRTLAVLRATVPPEVPGIAFLSGGQDNERACANLAAVNAAARGWAPWRLTFSFGRALVSDALHAWRGDPARVADGKAALAANCARASAASLGAGEPGGGAGG